jgi:hypothetical protein
MSEEEVQYFNTWNEAFAESRVVNHPIKACCYGETATVYPNGDSERSVPAMDNFWSQ